MSSLRVLDLLKTYAAPREEIVVLDGVSLALEAGQSLAIMGPSGSGKSTLLHILGALERPTSGRVELGGEDPFTLQDEGLARFRNRRIGLVFQDHHLLPQLTALENVLLPALAAGGVTAEAETWGRSLLDRVGLSGRLEHFPSELSGGEKQRIAIARALIQKPLLLLCDEPTGNLDAAAASSVRDLFLELHAVEKNILILVTHSERLAASFQARAELRGGRLIAS